MFIDTIKKEDYILGQVFKTKFGLEEPLFEYMGQTEESVREYLKIWIKEQNQEFEPEQNQEEEDLGNSIKAIMPNFDNDSDEDDEEIYTSIDEDEEEEEELEVEDILEDSGIDMPANIPQPTNGTNGNSSNPNQEEEDDELPSKKITIQSSTEWFSINNSELLKVLQNHDKVQNLYSLLKDTPFSKLFNRQLTIEDLPVTPDPKQKKSGSGVGKGRGRRKQGKSGRDLLLESSSLIEFINYLRECESSPKTQKTLCSELDEKFNSEVSTNSAFMSQDLAVMRLLDELSAEFSDVEDWVKSNLFTWSDATAVMKASRNEPDLAGTYNLLKARI